MKNVVLLILLVCFTIGTYAQQNPTAPEEEKLEKIENLTLGVNTGISIPLGQLQSTDPSGSEPGWAKDGFYMNFTGNYRLNKSWSLVGMLYYNQNPADENEMQPYYLNQVTDAIDEAVSSGDRLKVDTPDPSDANNVFFDVDEYMATSVLVGGKYTLPIKRWTWEVEALGGLQYTLLPKHTLRIRDESKPYLWAHQSTKDSDVSLAAMVSSSIRMPLTPRTQLRFTVSYYYSRVDVEQELSEFSNGTQNNRTSNSTDISYKLNYTTLNAGFGIIYNF